MVVQCSAFGCENKSSPESRKENITFYKFPLHDPHRLDNWTKAVNYGLPPEKRITPNQYNSLCSLHFENNYVERNGPIQRLKPNAIPTKFNGKIINVLSPVTKTPSSLMKTKVNSTSIKSKLEKSGMKTPNKLLYNKSVKTPKVLFNHSAKKSAPKPLKVVPRSAIPNIPQVIHPAITKVLIVKLIDGEPFCSVPNCESESTADLTYVSFPNDRERYEEWVTLMGRSDLMRAEGSSVAKNAVICTNHFGEDMWVKSKTRSKLVKHAVPSIFPSAVKKEYDSEETDSDYKSDIIYRANSQDFNINERKVKFEEKSPKKLKPGPKRFTVPPSFDDDPDKLTDLSDSSKHLTLEEKISVIRRYQSGEVSLEEVGEEFGLTKICVRNLLKSKVALFKKAEELGKFPTPPQEMVSEVERRLMIWVRDCQSKGVSVSDSSALLKAKEFYQDLSQERDDVVPFAEFNKKTSWFKTFKYNIGLSPKVKAFTSAARTPTTKRKISGGYNYDDDFDTPSRSPKKGPPSKKQCVSKENLGNNLTCPVCSRELSKFDRLRNHLIKIHDYYINEDGGLVPPIGVVEQESSDSDGMAPDDFLQVNLLEGTDVKSLVSNKDKGLEAVLKLKSDEIQDLKKEIERLKSERSSSKPPEVDSTKLDDQQSETKDLGQAVDAPTASNAKSSVEYEYTAEDKKLWENLVLAEIKKSKKYMEGLEKAQKVLNAQMKKNLQLKQALKKSSGGDALKKKLNDEIQKNRRLMDKVKHLQDELKHSQKSTDISTSKNDKIGSIYVKLKKAEENLKMSHCASSEQLKQFKMKYGQQTRAFQKKVKQMSLKYNRLQKKCKVMSARLNGIREIGSISQLIRDAGKYLTHQQVIFTEGQMKASAPAHEKFWSPAYQEMIHSLYQTSPKSYKTYMSFFALPPVHVVKRWISDNELVTRGINEAFVSAFTEEAKSLQDLNKKYDDFTPIPETEKNNNVKFNEPNMPLIEDSNIESALLQPQIMEENLVINGLENIPDQDEEQLEQLLQDDEEEEGKDNGRGPESTENMFDSDDEEEGVLKSDLADLADSDWSDDSDSEGKKNGKGLLT